jgi:hypothetical protein
MKDVNPWPWIIVGLAVFWAVVAAVLIWVVAS